MGRGTFSSFTRSGCSKTHKVCICSVRNNSQLSNLFHCFVTLMVKYSHFTFQLNRASFTLIYSLCYRAFYTWAQLQKWELSLLRNGGSSQVSVHWVLITPKLLLRFAFIHRIGMNNWQKKKKNKTQWVLQCFYALSNSISFHKLFQIK